MNNNIKLIFDENEKVIIINSLNNLRTNLSNEDRTIDFLDDIILKVSDSKKTELDLFESKIIINALNTFRVSLKELNKPRTEVNNLLLKVIDETDKKTLTLKKKKRGNRGR